MARYLVTGGAGFIGSHLVEARLRGGHDVRALDDLSTGRRENLAEADAWAAAGGGSFALIEDDIRDPDACRGAMEGVEFVFHQAAIPSVQRSVQDPVATNAVNLGGTLNLLEAARRETSIRRFVFASSSSIYGESEALPKVETMPPAPISPYGLQKLGAETYCRLFHRLYGTPTVALRYFNVFGPRQDPTSEYSAVIPLFVTAVKQGRAPRIYGDGEQTRDFTYIGNVVHANLQACRASERALGGAYNIALGDRISLNQLVAEIGRQCGKQVDAEHADPRPGDIRHSMADIGLAREYLGYRPEIDMVRGLRHTMEAY